MKKPTRNINPKSESFRHRLEFKIFNFLKRWGKDASEKKLEKGAILLDILLYFGLRICRKIVSTNLKIAFPKLTKKERKEIAR